VFKQANMSATKIDVLLELWAASMIKHDDIPPYNSHRNIYSTIDATEVGEVPWQSFSGQYGGQLPDSDIQSWMEATYEVLFQDPQLMVHNIPGNQMSDGKIDTTPYWKYGPDGQCQ
jgi:hypothetical protein